MRYLLDTNILSDLIRDPQGRVAKQIRKVGEEKVCTSIVVAAELRFGAAKKNSQRLTDQVNVVLRTIEVLPVKAPADAAYGRIRTQLELAGRPIGGNDLWIAAQCVSLGYTLVSDNTAEFARVDKLAVQNWLRP